MSVVYKGKHHRNPSGCNNKAKWILSETKWNRAGAIRLVNNIMPKMSDSKQRTSWYVALGIALAMYEESRLNDIIVAKVIERYINRHYNVMPHYILDYATSLCDYIRKEASNGI